MDAKRSARAQVRDWRRLKELMDEGTTIPDATEGGSARSAEADQGFAVSRCRVVGPPGYYKRTQWALAVVARYKRNVAMGSPVLQYPNEPLFTRTRAEMNDGTQEDVRRRMADRKANRLRALRAGGVVAGQAAPKVRRDAKARRVQRRSRVRP